MGVFEPLGGVGVTSAPLINFDVIVDEDISLLLYILKEVRNHDVFDLDKIENYKSLKDVIAEVYHASYTNPLYFLMKNDSDKEFLDECYKEFMEEPEFLSRYAITTDMYELVNRFNRAGEIHSTIIYKNKFEKDIIDNDEMLSGMLVEPITLVKMENYSQIFLNKLEDARRYMNSVKRTFYFSSRGSNLTEDKTDMIESDIIAELCKFNSISVFDMYKSEHIGRSLF